MLGGLALLLAGCMRCAQAQTAPAAGNSSGNPTPPAINFSPPAMPGVASSPTSLVPTTAAPASTTADIHDVHNLIPLTFWERDGTLIICGSIAGILLLSVLLWLALRKKPAVCLTPYQIAMRDLEKTRGYAAGGQDKAFAAATSDAVRHYLENAYKMPAPERTTEEFLAEAARHAWLRGELAARLRRFLEFCDLAKFAGQEFGTAEREQLLDAAREFLDAAEANRQPPARPAAAGPPPPATPPRPPAVPPPLPTVAAS